MFARSKSLAVGVIVFLLSCNQNQHESKDVALSETFSVADTTIPASSAAVENNADSSRRFIRTADLKFKVKNVFEATNAIEDITTSHDGFITFTNLTSSTDEIKTRTVSKDSLLESTYYSVNNSITLRVPNHKLDTVLKDISKNIAHLDYRIIKADDVSLQLLSNRRNKERNLRMENRVRAAIDKSGKNLNDIVDAEETIFYKGQEGDEAEISNLDLGDKINFSTVSLVVYQRQTVKTELIATDKYVDEYRPGFGVQLLEALQIGTRVFEFLVLSLVKIWPMILIALIILLFYKRRDNKIKNVVRSA